MVALLFIYYNMKRCSLITNCCRVFLFFLLGGLFSCSNTDRANNGEELKEIEIGKAIANREEVNLSDYASSIEYLPLENCSQALLSQIDYKSYPRPNGSMVPYYLMATGMNRDYDGFKKFLSSNNLLLFFYPNYDAYSQQVCHVFDMNGKFVKKIEYDPSDASLLGKYCNVCCNYVDDNKLYVVVNASDLKERNKKERKLLIYDITAGNLLNSLPFRGDNFISVGSYGNFYKSVNDNVSYGHIVDADFQTSDQVFISREKETKKSLENAKNPRFAGVPMKVYTRSFVHKSGDGLVVLRESSDTINKIYFPDNKAVSKPAYRVDFADTLSAVMRGIKLDIVNYAETESLIFMQIAENKDYPFGKELRLDKEFKKLHYYQRPTEDYNNQIYSGKESVWHIVYNKVSGAAKSPEASNPLWMGGMANDIDGGAPFWPEIVDGKKMFQVVKAVDFIKLSEVYNSPKMKEVASGLTPDSNPVVVVVTLK